MMNRVGTALETVEVTSRSQLRDWLRANHRRKDSVWLITHKKSEGDRYVSYDAIVEEALCFGWIDSVPRTLDARRSMRLLSPRKPGSAWSAVNKQRVEKLIASRQMTAAGLAGVKLAQQDGSWSRLDAVEALAVPEDLSVALAAVRNASEYFAAFPRSTKRAFLEWIA